jgi:hypothetical protein
MPQGQADLHGSCRMIHSREHGHSPCFDLGFEPIHRLFRPNVLGRWSVHLRPWHTLPIGKSQRSLLQVRLSSLDASCAALSILTIFSFDQVVMPIVVRLCFAASRPVATERPLLAIASRDCCICVEGRARQVSSLGLLLRSPHARLA